MIKNIEESKYMKQWFSDKENEQAVLDYIFGKRNDNPLKEVRKMFSNKKSKIKK